MDSEDECGPSTPRKSKTKTERRKQRYREAWEKNPEYKNWLCRDPVTEDKAKCKVCNVSFVSDLSNVKRHDKSESHIKNMKSVSFSSQRNLSSFLIKEDHLTSVDKLAHVAEIKFAGFLAEHNISFKAMDHLQDVIKQSFPDSKLQKKCK